MIFLIVSGLSGSGKSVALQALEDMGYYCIDNLPAALLPHVAREMIEADASGTRNAAVGIDARNRSFLDALPEALTELDTLGIDHRIIFLEAEESMLVKRFKETRRRHPLTDRDTPLLEGIRLEMRLLEPLSSRAVVRFDTTHTTPHELRDLIYGYAQAGESGATTLLFESFGFKHGAPLDADYVFDVRCLPNPYWQHDLRPLTGRDGPVIEFLQRHDQVRRMRDQLCAFLEQWLPEFARERRSYLTVAIGCTGGQHRAVYLTEQLAAHFADRGYRTQVRHRELK